MARIPDFQPENSIRVPGAPNLPGGVRVPELGAGAAAGEMAIGRGLTQFGGAVANLGQDVAAYQQRKDEEAAQAWLAKARAQTVLDWPTQEQQLQSDQGTPAMAVGGAGVAPAVQPKPLVQRTADSLNSYQTKILAAAPNQRAKEAYQSWFAEWGANKQAAAIDYQQKRQDAQRNADFITAMDTHSRIVSADPTQFDAAWSQVEKDLHDAAAWADPSTLAKLRIVTREKMELARAQTLATTNPLQLQREVTATPGNQGPENPQKPYGGFAENKYYSHLDPAQIASLAQDANTAVVQQHNAAVAQQKAAYDQRYNGLMTSLLPGGNGGMADVWQARRDGWLTDYTDIKKAIDAIDTRDKQSMDLAKAQALFTTGHQFNPFTEGDKKATDLVYQAAGGTDALLGAPAGAGLSAHGQGSADPQAQAQLRLFAFTEKTGIVPTAAVDEIRRGMISQDRGEMTAAYTLFDGLSRAKETAAAAKLAFNEQDWKKLEQYQQLAPITPPEELVQAMNPAVDPQTAKKRDELMASGKKLLDSEVAKGTDYLPDIMAHFNTSAFGDYPHASPDALTVQALRDDYETAFQRAYSFSGDETLAKAAALKSLDLHWHQTSVGSGVVLMQNPPERYFLPIGGPENFDWMDRQIEDMTKASYPGAQSWAPVSLPQTGGAAALKMTPMWGISVIDKDGVLQHITPPPDAKPGWPFDFNAAQAQAAAEFNAVRGSLLDVQPPSPVGPKFNDIMNLMDQRAGRVVGSPTAREAGRPRARTEMSDTPFPPPVVKSVPLFEGDPVP